MRAAAPWPGAWTEIGDRLVTLVRVRPTRDFPGALEPSEAAVRLDGVAVVRTGDAALELHEGRDEGNEPGGAPHTLGTGDFAALVTRARSLGYG